jgi:hypothetical protein
MFDHGLRIDNQLLAGFMIVVCLLAFFAPKAMNKIQGATIGKIIPSTKASYASRYATFDQTASMGGHSDQIGLTTAGTIMQSCGAGGAEWGLSRDSYAQSGASMRKGKKRLVMGASTVSDRQLQAHLN